MSMLCCLDHPLYWRIKFWCADCRSQIWIPKIEYFKKNAQIGSQELRNSLLKLMWICNALCRLPLLTDLCDPQGTKSTPKVFFLDTCFYFEGLPYLNLKVSVGPTDSRYACNDLGEPSLPNLLIKIDIIEIWHFFVHLSLCCEMSQQLGDLDLARGDLETESDMMCFLCYEFMLNS